MRMCPQHGFDRARDVAFDACNRGFERRKLSVELIVGDRRLDRLHPGGDRLARPRIERPPRGLVLAVELSNRPRQDRMIISHRVLARVVAPHRKGGAY
jgi:hypothetical protein